MTPSLTRYSFVVLGVCAAMLAGCGSSQKAQFMPDGQCIALADGLKTLRAGDELPRVIEVLGQPSTTYRVRGSSLFGQAYDVLVYNTNGSACGRILLSSPKALHLMFNEQGRLIAESSERFKGITRATMARGSRLGGF